MRTSLRLFSLIAAMALPVAIWANVIVKGHVTYQNGQPAGNVQVHIQSDSSNAICGATHIKYTNIYGIYQDTLVCANAIAHVRVWILDCHNTIVYHNLAVHSSGIVETNFVVCANDGCHSRFGYAAAAPPNNVSGFYFNGASSTTAAGDSITQYHWAFGDGATATTKDPYHAFTKPGNYTVCLTIVSKSGCTDSTCQLVIVPPIHCHAEFTYLPIVTATPSATAGNIHFNGAPSTTAASDSITQYRWAFGDGATASTKDPYHAFAKPGNYTVCLTIVSKAGCTDSTCKSIITAAPPPTTCSAHFTFTDTGLNGHFNSAQINVAPDDSIINRYWTFGDGQTLAGNVVSPLHHYSHADNYQVCLKVVTRLGCASENCTTVRIAGENTTPNIEFVGIKSVYPNPATTEFHAIVYSKYNNVDATLSIYDVYGTLKWRSQTLLSQGNASIVIPISQLGSGSYILRLTTIYGIDSKRFFKL